MDLWTSPIQVSNLESRLERAAASKEQDITAIKQEKEKHVLAAQKLETQNVELVTLCEKIKGDFGKQSDRLKDLEDLQSRLQHDLELKDHCLLYTSPSPRD